MSPSNNQTPISKYYFTIFNIYISFNSPQVQPEPNAPCPNVCIDVQHQNRTLLVPMYVSMFNSNTRTERSLSQCMYRCSTPTPEPNAPCPNVCIDVQLVHQNLRYKHAGTFDLVDTCMCLMDGPRLSVM